MSIFRKTNGLTGENTSTEILAYFLSSKNDFIPFQKLFFQKIIDLTKSSTEIDVEISTQNTFSKGRPDFIALTNNSLMVFENKLGSYLSGEEQLIRYSDIFDDINSFNKVFPFIKLERIEHKYLILIAPENIIQVSKIITESKTQEKYKKAFIEYCSEKDVDFITISWEEILNDLDRTNSLQNELYLYVENYINQELKEEEMKILKDSNVPTALNKIFNIISNLKDTISVEGYKIERVGQSYNYYGFKINYKLFSFWFGYMFPIWRSHETPIFLQLKEEWITDKRNRDDILKLLDENKFQQEDNEGYILPFEIDNIATWKHELIKIMKDFKGKLASP